MNKKQYQERQAIKQVLERYGIDIHTYNAMCGNLKEHDTYPIAKDVAFLEHLKNIVLTYVQLPDEYWRWNGIGIPGQAEIYNAANRFIGQKVY